MIIDNDTPLSEEIRYFAMVGIPSVLLAWLIGWGIEVVSRERDNPVLNRGYATLLRWFFFGNEPPGSSESTSRAARFRLLARLFRYFPMTLLALWAIRIAIRLVGSM